MEELEAKQVQDDKERRSVGQRLKMARHVRREAVHTVEIRKDVLERARAAALGVVDPIPGGIRHENLRICEAGG